MLPRRFYLTKYFRFVAVVSMCTTCIFVFNTYKEITQEHETIDLLTTIKWPDVLLENNKTDSEYLGPNIYKRKEAVMQSYFKFLGENLTKEDESVIREYYQPRKERVNPIDYAFVGRDQIKCDSDHPPFLVIMCLSKPDSALERKVIRLTWGQMQKHATREVKIVFIVAKSNHSTDDAVEREHKKHGDIIRISSKDTYRNLTTKVLMGIKWTSTYCPGVKFFMKTDEDCFVHVHNAIKLLENLEVPKHGVILGNVNFRHHVQRTDTKWAITEEEFPFKKMPLYTNGQSYVISGNILGRLIEAGEHMPYISIEDGFITGVLRTVIGASVVPTRGFPHYMMTPASPCSFHNDRRISATNNSPAQMKKIWDGPHVPLDRTAVVTKRVRKYTHENDFYTVLACSNIHDPGKIFYQLEISKPKGSKRKSSERRDFYIFNRLLQEFPIPTEIYEKAEDKLKRKIDYKMLELLENKIKSLEENTAQVSLPCQKSVNQPTQEKKYQKPRRKNGKGSQKKGGNRRRGGKSKVQNATKTRKTQLKGDNCIKGMPEVKEPECNVRHGVKDLIPTTLPTSSLLHFDPEVCDVVRDTTQQEQSENSFSISTADKTTLQMLLRLASHFGRSKHNKNRAMEPMSNRNNALVKWIDKKRDSIFGFYIEVNLNKVDVTFDTIDTHEKMLSQLTFKIWINGILRFITVAFRHIADVSQMLVPVLHKELQLTEFRLIQNKHVDNQQPLMNAIEAPDDKTIELHPDNHVIDVTSNNDDDDDDNGDDDEFIGGIMGVYCRSSIHVDYKGLFHKVDSVGECCYGY
ncbi:Beta-1 [Mactra antiquata]